VFTTEQREDMLNELNGDNNVLDCSVNFNGNHVIQKILMNMGKDGTSLALKKFISAIEKDFVMLCQHENGCRVIQRMIDHCSQDMVKPIVDKVLSKYNVFIKD
jgi:pumilio RNA-binding family